MSRLIVFSAIIFQIAAIGSHAIDSLTRGVSLIASRSLEIRRFPFSYRQTLEVGGCLNVRPHNEFLLGAVSAYNRADLHREANFSI